MSAPSGYLRLLGAGIVATFTGQAYSAGFAIIEHSASGTATAYAGAAAVANDPSTIWFNPAGMMEIEERSFTVAGHIINVTSDFTNEGTSLNPQLGGDDIVGTEGDPGALGLVPNLYYIAPLSNDMRFGIGLNAPYGLETDYDDDWVGRYQALNSAVLTININPALAWQLNDNVSVGAGINAQYIEAKLSNAIDSGSVCLGTAPNNAARAQCLSAGLTPGNPDNDGFAEVEGDGWSFNFNAGLLYKFNEGTQVGVAYRSAIAHEVEGDAKFEVDPTLQQFLDASGSTAFTATDITAEADLPASLSLSIAHQLDSKIQILGDITWTQWSSFEELRVQFDNPAQPDSVTTEDWDDVMRYSVGVNYQHSDKLIYRAGLAFDEEPIPSVQRRTPRIPGNDRTWVALGLGYKVSDTMSLDFGFAHLFVEETPIDHTDESLGHTTRGTYDADVNILSAQLNWTFN